MFNTTQGAQAAPLQMTWFVAGSPPQTPPSLWRGGAVTSTTITSFVPALPLPATPVACSQWVTHFDGGMLGSAVLFPTLAAGGTWSVVGDNTADTAVYPLIAFPASSITDETILRRINENQYLVDGVLAPEPAGGYVTTGGMWIQQIWWVANATALQPANTYNITALFVPKTIPGTGATALPLNACFLEISPRTPPADPAADPEDGAFDVRISLPRTIVCPDSTAIYSRDGGGNLPATFDAVAAAGYFIVILACVGEGATPVTIRSSDGVVPPLGQAGVTMPTLGFPTNYQLGQFSIYPPAYTGVDPNNRVANYFSFLWNSTPIGANAGTWYTGAPNLAGQLVLVPPV